MNVGHFYVRDSHQDRFYCRQVVAEITEILSLLDISVSLLSVQGLTWAYLTATVDFADSAASFLVPLRTSFLSRLFCAHGMQSGGLLH